MTTVEQVPPPARRLRAWGTPVATAVAAAAGCVVVALVDPAETNRYPVCPFRVLTGLWCPACGSLRALHALLRGDVVAAAGSNALLLVALPAMGYVWLVWATPRIGGPRLPRPRLRPGVQWGMLTVALTFGVLRNLPTFSLLAP